MLERLSRTRQPSGRRRAAGATASRATGPGTASVRFICGKFAPHVELERDLAGFLHTDAALTFVSCWNANAALLDALCDRAHRRLLRPAQPRLDHRRHAPRAARPTRRSTSTPTPTTCARALARRRRSERRLIVTDGVFSMEGDLAPLDELARDRRASTRRPCRRRLARHRRDRRDRARRARALRPARRARGLIFTGTLGKALGGAAGGFVAGGEALCAVLEQRSRPQLFSNGLPPTVAASARQALGRAARAARSWSPACARNTGGDAGGARGDWPDAARRRERDRADHRRRDRGRDRDQRGAARARRLRHRVRLPGRARRAPRGSGSRSRRRSSASRSKRRRGGDRRRRSTGSAAVILLRDTEPMQRQRRALPRGARRLEPARPRLDPRAGGAGLRVPHRSALSRDRARLPRSRGHGRVLDHVHRGAVGAVAIRRREMLTPSATTGSWRCSRSPAPSAARATEVDAPVRAPGDLSRRGGRADRRLLGLGRGARAPPG